MAFCCKISFSTMFKATRFLIKGCVNIFASIMLKSPITKDSYLFSLFAKQLTYTEAV